MAHFAQINADSIVEQVICVANSVIIDSDGKESEQLGIEFCQSLYGKDTTWLQTSYNGTIRRNFAGVGVQYYAPQDVFLPPKPYPSWVLNEQTLEWEAPVAPPVYLEDYYMGDGTGSQYYWDEEKLSWMMHGPTAWE